MGYFIFSTILTDFLFHGLTVTSVLKFDGICVLVAALVLLLEINKTLLAYLAVKKAINPALKIMQEIQTEEETEQEDASLTASRHSRENSPDAILRPLRIPASIEILKKQRWMYHILASIVYSLHAVLGFLIMLSVMSYNAWILITVTLVSGITYFVFGAIRQYITIKFAPIMGSSTSILS